MSKRSAIECTTIALPNTQYKKKEDKMTKKIRTKYNGTVDLNYMQHIVRTLVL